MAIREDLWLAERLGHPVFTVGPDTDPGEVEAHVREPGRKTYQMRIDTDRIDAVRSFTDLGFYVVEATLVFGRTPAPTEAGREIVAPRPEHRLPVVDIGRTAFRYSRFHLDPAISQETADRIKADWVESYFAGTRGDHILVGLLDGEPAGFLAVLASTEAGRTLRTIDLVAVAGAAQGRGVARALTAEFLTESVGVCDEVVVGTQAANVPATRLYESMGFQLTRTAYALHLHTHAPRSGA